MNGCLKHGLEFYNGRSEASTIEGEVAGEKPMEWLKGQPGGEWSARARELPLVPLLHFSSGSGRLCRGLRLGHRCNRLVRGLAW